MCAATASVRNRLIPSDFRVEGSNSSYMGLLSSHTDSIYGRLKGWPAWLDLGPLIFWLDPLDCAAHDAGAHHCEFGVAANKRVS